MRQAGEDVDEAVWKRFAARLTYLQGDFAEADTYTKVADALGGAINPVFYLEIHRRCSRP